MAAMWLRVRAELRASWRSVVLLAVVLGIGSGVAIAAVAGARRTDTALGRYTAHYRPEQVEVADVDPVTMQRVIALPEVAASQRRPYIVMAPSRTGAGATIINPFAYDNAAAMRTIDRPIVVDGRLPRPDRADEAVVNEAAVKGHNLRVGSHITFYAYSSSQVLTLANRGFGALTKTRPAGPRYTMRIVGVVREPADILSDTSAGASQHVLYEGQQSVFMTPAFLAEYAHNMGASPDQVPGAEFAGVRLRRGAADIPAFTREARRVAGSKAFVHVGSDAVDAAHHLQQGARLDALALLLFGLLAAVGTVAIVGQSMARLIRNSASDADALAAVGMARSSLVAVAMARVTIVAIGGAILALPIAFALSRFTPIGVARQAEVHPGVEFNAAMLFAGVAAIVALMLLRGFATAWSASRRHAGDASAHRRRWLPSGARMGVTADAATAIMLRPKRSRAAAGAALLAASIAIGTVAAALTFGASLRRVVANPREQGWNWDALVGNPNSQADLTAAVSARLRAMPSVGGYSGLGTPTDAARVDGVNIDAIGALEALHGSVWPTVAEGRAPVRDGEMLVATRTLHDLHRRVGDTVTVTVGNVALRQRIVGRVVMPSAGDVLAPGLGRGIVLTMHDARRLDPTIFPTTFAVRATHASERAAMVAALDRAFPGLVLVHVPADDVANLQRVSALPLLLAALLAILGGATMANALVTASRRNRGDLAVLKALGFRNGQIARVIQWQAVATVVLAVAVGLPVGIAVGRLAWRAAANSIGSIAPPRVPVLAMLAVLPAAAAIALVIATLPAWLAGRVRAADALHTQ